MPYTPPYQQSPVASRPESPSNNRSHTHHKAHHHQVSLPPSPGPKPELPRSASSTAYLHKHRRSPSISKSTSLSESLSTPNATPTNVAPAEVNNGAPTFNGFSHQSQLLIDEAVVAIGAMMSPPDSSQNSSDDEENSRRRRVRDLENFAELQAAIRVIEQHRQSSPTRFIEEAKKANMTIDLGTSNPKHLANIHIPGSEALPRPPLSEEARKISHSRSCTESSVVLDSPRSSVDYSPGHSLSDSDSEDVGKRRKPPMVRKKSGELVRPALRPSTGRRRPSSMPGTPTYGKAVHFDSHLEQVRHFLQVDRPLAVSAGSSPVECYEGELEFPFGNDDFSSRSPPFEWEIRLSNFPRDSVEKKVTPVRVEKVYLSSDNKNLVGDVAVANIAFHKLVVARFTLDYWKTTSEVVADFNNDVRRKHINDGYDRFHFSIKLADQANLENKTMFFCVRYNVNGQEHWDNNESINYQVDFSKKAKAQNGKNGMQGNNTRQANGLPRSKPSPPTSSGMPRSFNDYVDGFGSDFHSFPQPASKVIGESPIRFKKQGAMVPDAPGRQANAAGQAFSNRYDFSASLSAAISAASNTLGERSGLQTREDVRSAPAKQLSFTQGSVTESPTSVTTPSFGKRDVPSEAKMTAHNGLPIETISSPSKPAALTSEKPSLSSSSYHELLDKYCFFGSAKGSPQLTKPGHGQNDGGNDDSTEVSHSLGDSIDPSPTSPPSPLSRPRQISPPAEEKKSLPKISSTRNSRSASPATRSDIRSRTASPVSFGYPYGQSMQNGFFPEAHAQTAILG